MNQLFIKSFKSALFTIVFLLGALAFNQSFAWENDLGGNQYNANEARRYQQVKTGVVEDIREVVITRESRNNAYVGTAVGGIAGGLLGSAVGKGNGRMIAAAIGGTAGAFLGNKVSENMGREVKRSAEIIVSLQNGNTVAITQELDSETAQLQTGDRVRLIEGQAIRVVRMRNVM